VSVEAAKNHQELLTKLQRATA